MPGLLGAAAGRAVVARPAGEGASVFTTCRSRESSACVYLCVVHVCVCVSSTGAACGIAL